MLDSLYYCEKRDREDDWILVERVREMIEKLHRLAHQRSRNDREAFANWQAYRLFAGALAAQLPMSWQAVGCDNLTQNHVVLEVPMTFGQVLREKNDTLCKPHVAFDGHLQTLADVPTCKQCLLMAEEIVHLRVQHLLEDSFERT